MSDAPLTLWGETHVRELLAKAPGRVDHVLVEEGWVKRRESLRAALQSSGVVVKAVTPAQIVQVGGREARGIVAVLRPSAPLSLEELMKSLPEKAVLMALDGVTDPGNLGAILRSAVFFGASGILLPKDNSASLNSASLRRSAGAMAWCPVVEVVNLGRALTSLKEAGFWVYGTTPHEGTLLWQEAFPARSCFVLGGEGKGVRPGVLRHCDLLLRLPGDFESLNVSAFGAVLLYEWYRGVNGRKGP